MGLNWPSSLITSSPGTMHLMDLGPSLQYTTVSGCKHWSTYLAVLLNTRNIGTIPLLVPFVPRMCELVALTL